MSFSIWKKKQVIGEDKERKKRKKQENSKILKGNMETFSKGNDLVFLFTERVNCTNDSSDL